MFSKQDKDLEKQCNEVSNKICDQRPLWTTSLPWEVWRLIFTHLNIGGEHMVVVLWLPLQNLLYSKLILWIIIIVCKYTSDSCFYQFVNITSRDVLRLKFSLGLWEARWCKQNFFCCHFNTTIIIIILFCRIKKIWWCRRPSIYFKMSCWHLPVCKSTSALHWIQARPGKLRQAVAQYLAN